MISGAKARSKLTDSFRQRNARMNLDDSVDNFNAQRRQYNVGIKRVAFEYSRNVNDVLCRQAAAEFAKA